MTQDQSWFELRDVRKRIMDRDAWVVLRANEQIDDGPETLTLGRAEEYFAAASASVPISQRDCAESAIGWQNLSLMQDHAPCVQAGVYQSADAFQPFRDEIRGTYLVLCQRGSRIEHDEWHVHPDLVLGLHLKREGDSWFALNEGYEIVIRMSRNKSGSPALMEIRSSYLKDFLAARSECLCVSSYRSRKLILLKRPAIDWSEDPTVEESPGQKWQGTITETTERGHRFGSEVAILHVGRQGFDREQDVPEVGISDEFTTRRYTRSLGGTRLFRIWGELWKVDFIEPGRYSSRVRGDDVPSQIFFFTDGAGQKESAEELNRKGRWLWFKADVINKALDYRGASLIWYTADTGRIDFGSHGGVVFGMNGLGLVNVYAKDIRYSPDWQQQIWAGFNVIPNGGVSRELLMAQAEGSPAMTDAPERFLVKSIELLNESTQKLFGVEMIKRHQEYSQLARLVHRFRAVNEAGFYALAKDIARITADSIDLAALQKIAPVSKGERRGSLKSLEQVLAKALDPTKAHSIMTPLFGAYELRLADAHLPPTELEEAFRMVSAERKAPWIIQGARLLDSVVSSLNQIAISFCSKESGKSADGDLEEWGQ